MRSLRVKLGAPAAVLAAVLAVAGCGSGSDSGDPARLAPAGSALYLGLTVQPQGKIGTDAEAATAKILGTPNPAARIVQLIDKAAATHDPQFSFAQDVAPWLGKRIGLAFPSLQGASQPVAIVATSDSAKAASSIQRVDQHQHYTRGSYRGVSYWRDPSTGNLDAVVGGFVVSGNETGFRQVVDVEQGSAKSLASESAFSSATAGASQKLGFAYLDLGSALKAVTARQPSSAAGLQLLGLGSGNIKPIVATLSADAQAITIDIQGGQGNVVPFGLHGIRTTSLIGQLPGDAWGAAGIANLGQVIGEVESFFRSNALLGQQVATAEAKLKRTRGIDIRGDLIPALGDTAFFIRGTNRATVGGGAVVQIADQAAFARLFAHLPAALRTYHARAAHVGSAAGLKLKTKRGPVFVVRSGGRAVIAYGSSATSDALSGSSTLSTTPEFAAAARSVGGRPGLFLAMAPLLDLVRATTSGQSASFQRAEPYLARFSYVAAGSPSSSVTRIVLGLR